MEDLRQPTPISDLTRIGTIEHVDLPKAGANGLFGVPAKIDTGADSSAIWASDIIDDGQRLTFVLFGVGSPLYTGEVLMAEKYKVISVKNSFGATELRYKIPLHVVLGGKTIRANVTLANRANNRYPLLIGRKTLHGKFLVDVARKPSKASCKILMLSTKWTPVTQRYAGNITSDSQKLELSYATYEDIDYMVGPSGSEFVLRQTGADIAGYDLVYFKTTSKYMDIAAATARYLEKRKVPFIDETIKHYPGSSKLYQYALLEASSIRVPASVFMLPLALSQSFETIAGRIGLPFVLKDIHGNRGEHNYLISDKASFERACMQASQDGVQCIAQAFIANDCDYRVLVMGRKVALVIKRSRQDEATHLNNTSQGAKAEIVPAESLPPAIQKACLEAAELVGRQIAGVDMLQDKNTGLWYCLEVNDGPQLASGSFVDEKHRAVADYLERKLA